MTRRVILFFSVVIIAGGIFLLAKNCFAASPLDVSINEIAWMGSTVSSTREWIELKNNSSTEIGLSGWSLKISSSSEPILLSGSITGYGYYLLERPTNNSVPDILADLIYSGSLANNGSNLLLKNGDNIIDTVDCGGGWFAGNLDRHTMERINPLLPATSGNWQNSKYLNGSPRADNYFNIFPVANAGLDVIAYVGETISFNASSSTDDSSIIKYEWDFGDGATTTGVTTTHIYESIGIFTSSLRVTDDYDAFATTSISVTILPLESTSTEATTTPYVARPSDVVINEFVSDPETGQNEWIELFNNTTSTIDISDWFILDGSGATTTLVGEIVPLGDMIIEKPKGNLNNDGDEIVLKNKDGLIIDQVVYGNWSGDINNAPAPGKGYSTARNTDGYDSDNSKNDFSETTVTTQGAQNSIVPKPASSRGGGGSYVPPVIPILFHAGDVAINEIVSDPVSGADEWIELYNNTDALIDLSGWNIEDGSGAKTSLTGAIFSKGFTVILKPTGSLNNVGDKIILKDPSGNIIDTLVYGTWAGNQANNALVAVRPNSLARIKDGIITGNNKSDFALTASTTKGLPNIIKLLGDVSATSTPTSTPEIVSPDADTEIIITEIYPNTSGKDEDEEFIELYNNGDGAVNLSGWAIDDGAGGSRPFKIGALIMAPGSHVVLDRKMTGITLNNNFDSVRLYDSAGKLVDQVDYAKSPKGFSFALDKNGKWQWTDKITKGSANIFNEAISPKAVVVKKVAAKKGGVVRVTGTVLVEPGVLGAQIFYINGMQVYSYKKYFPKIKRGDVISVTGKMSEGTDEPRIKIASASDIKILDSGPDASPQKISSSDINESLKARLVQIAGEVVEVKGGSIYVDDGTDEMRVYVKDSASIKDLKIIAGDKISVVGVLSQTKSGYRLLPRDAADFVINQKGEVKGVQETAVVAVGQTGNGINKYLVVLIVFLGLVLLKFLWDKISFKKKIAS